MLVALSLKETCQRLNPTCFQTKRNTENEENWLLFPGGFEAKCFAAVALSLREPISPSGVAVSLESYPCDYRLFPAMLQNLLHLAQF